MYSSSYSFIIEQTKARVSASKEWARKTVEPPPALIVRETVLSRAYEMFTSVAATGSSYRISHLNLGRIVGKSALWKQRLLSLDRGGNY